MDVAHPVPDSVDNHQVHDCAAAVEVRLDLDGLQRVPVVEYVERVPVVGVGLPQDGLLVPLNQVGAVVGLAVVLELAVRYRYVFSFHMRQFSIIIELFDDGLTDSLASLRPVSITLNPSGVSVNVSCMPFGCASFTEATRYEG